LQDPTVRNVLVIGIDAAALAVSAATAGYKVFSVDYFGDQDLKQIATESLSILTQKPGKSCGRLENDFAPNKLLDLANELLARHRIDAALLASGLDDSPEVLERLNDLVPIIGNHPRTIARVRSKPGFLNELRQLGISSPRTIRVENLEEATLAAETIGYPVVIKPSVSLGGGGIRKANSRSELGRAFAQAAAFSSEILIQEHISGIDASVSFLASKKATVLLSLSEQLLGLPELGQKEPFGYCGNIVSAPLDETLTDTARVLARKIATHFDLAGSNGIDMVISKGNIPYIVEVNPRFQGTFECVQNAREVNLVRLHVEACTTDTLPDVASNPPTTAWARLILYARQRSMAPDLSAVEEARDRPLPGAIVEKGEPLCSIIVGGVKRDAVFRESMRSAERIYRRVESAPI
jgi:predicted ATP-grasp superfamily ATP-dependent carboligase